jgi:uncharacterized Fe-S radical SAM superfamily protein PflX
MKSSRIESYLSQLQDLKNASTSSPQIIDPNPTQQALKLSQLTEIGAVIERIVDVYSQLISYSNEIVTTKCSNLRNYVIDVDNFYFVKVKAILSRYISPPQQQKFGYTEIKKKNSPNFCS